MKSLKKLLIAAGAIALTACATATPYQPSQNASARNGFSETRIEQDRVRVTFDGNSLTKRETVESYLVYRAAELTKQNGYDYFTMVNRATDQNTRLQSTGFNDPYHGMFNYSYFHPRRGWSSPYYHPFYRSHIGSYGRSGFGRSGFGRSAFNVGFGFHDPFYDRWANDFDYREITRYKASAEIQFGRGLKPAGMPNAFNAAEVLSNLGPTIVYPEAKS